MRLHLTGEVVVMAPSLSDFLSFFDKMFDVPISRLVLSCDKGWGTRAIHCTVYMLVGNGSQSISAVTTLTYAAEHSHSKMGI